MIIIGLVCAGLVGDCKGRTFAWGESTNKSLLFLTTSTIRSRHPHVLHTEGFYMKFEQLWKIVLSNLKPELEQSKGLSIFAKERAKFEGWLKVKLCDSLSTFIDDVAPERDRIDVTFGDWAIELKSLNSTMLYTQLISFKDDDFTASVAHSEEEACKLVEAGFEHVCDFNGNKIFRKCK